MANQSRSFEVVLVGFPGLPQQLNSLVSVVMFLVYNISLCANGIVIGLIIFKHHLHQPMYFIIANLAVSDLLFDTITLPKIIAKYWFGAGTMTFQECLFQTFCVHYLGSIDSFIIMLMAVDRYVAICKPLRYLSIITNKVVALACSFSWIFLASFTPLMCVILNSQISFCGRKNINSCFCTNIGVTGLACTDVTLTKKLMFALAMVVLLVPLSYIILSYSIIIKTVHSSTNSENWQKAFYTCTTHLIVIVLYYAPRVFIYTANQVQLILNADLNVLLLCLYTYVPHMANPIIYCLRTKEIKQTFGKLLKKNHLTVKSMGRETIKTFNNNAIMQ
ncbi:olfactory receptor 6C74-like [Rhinophrynus dorsalis]